MRAPTPRQLKDINDFPAHEKAILRYLGTMEMQHVLGKRFSINSSVKKQEDVSVQYLITYSLCPDLCRRVKDLQTSREMMETLRNMYIGEINPARVAVQTQFDSIKIEQGESMEKFVHLLKI